MRARILDGAPTTHTRPSATMSDPLHVVERCRDNVMLAEE